MEIWLVWQMDIRDKVVCCRRGFQTMLYSPVALPIYYTCRIILQSFIVSASVAIIRNEILHSRLLYTCACKRSDTADMLCPANRIGFLVIPAYQASVRQSATGHRISLFLPTAYIYLIIFGRLLSLSLPHRAAKSKMAPYVEEFEESLAVSSKVPPSLVAPEPGTDAQYHCHNIHTLTLSRTLPRP